MRYAIVSDIHANLPAWYAVVENAMEAGATRFLCLGDLVGYGPNPREIVDDVRRRSEAVVMGNHDAVACGLFNASVFNPTARGVIEWTIDELTDEQKEYLSSLPLDVHLDGLDAHLVHAHMDEPGRFHYLNSKEDAKACFDACDHGLIFVGHTHAPGIYALSPEGDITQHEPGTFVRNADYRYIVNPGSVGDPRGEEVVASYCIYDTTDHSISHRFVEFDPEACRAAYRAVGLDAKPYFLRYLDRQVSQPEEVACFDESQPRKVVRGVTAAVSIAATRLDDENEDESGDSVESYGESIDAGGGVATVVAPKTVKKPALTSSTGRVAVDLPPQVVVVPKPPVKRQPSREETRERSRKGGKSKIAIGALGALAALGVGISLHQAKSGDSESESGVAVMDAAGVGELTTARYVRISLPRSGTLSLAEVEVISNGTNVAFQRQASQSSTHAGGDASHAVDGNTNGYFDEGSTTSTEPKQPGPWWEVDLGQMTPIDRVRVWNCQDGGAPKMRRLHNFTIEFYDESRQLALAKHKIPVSGREVEIESP
ncbi:metallophosphoesterase family protein [Sulfuriroseicoccus oceanibius]|uniref:Metallophosphoesterase family protein n=1 Tax=Sulfuriroseicoccus oceanibius TaxID=2707525 RepID=A0A6B3LBW7_9BACT|nr:metallophosphoesterase family protein [Sulfuriroseicoccus oceanibius]QQL45306.1 metallophosphoesterase family protein [Sulfuriroseicoccus oceanibius]